MLLVTLYALFRRTVAQHRVKVPWNFVSCFFQGNSLSVTQRKMADHACWHSCSEIMLTRVGRRSTSSRRRWGVVVNCRRNILRPVVMRKTWENQGLLRNKGNRGSYIFPQLYVPFICQTNFHFSPMLAEYETFQITFVVSKWIPLHQWVACLISSIEFVWFVSIQ